MASGGSGGARKRVRVGSSVLSMLRAPHARVHSRWRGRSLLLGDVLGRALRLRLQLQPACVERRHPLSVPLGPTLLLHVLCREEVGDDAHLDDVDVREEVVPELRLGELRRHEPMQRTLQVRRQLAVGERCTRHLDLMRLELLLCAEGQIVLLRLQLLGPVQQRARVLLEQQLHLQLHKPEHLAGHGLPERVLADPVVGILPILAPPAPGGARHARARLVGAHG